MLNEKMQFAIEQIKKPDCGRITVYVPDVTDDEIRTAAIPGIAAGCWLVVRRTRFEGCEVAALSWAEHDLYQTGINPYFCHPQKK